MPKVGEPSRKSKPQSDIPFDVNSDTKGTYVQTHRFQGYAYAQYEDRKGRSCLVLDFNSFSSSKESARAYGTRVHPGKHGVVLKLDLSANEIERLP